MKSGLRFHLKFNLLFSLTSSSNHLQQKYFAYLTGFDDDGIIAGMDVNLYTNSGFLSVDGEANDISTVTNFADSGKRVNLLFSIYYFILLKARLRQYLMKKDVFELDRNYLV